jgi:nucleoside 2-deoxyribosyltransferase
VRAESGFAVPDRFDWSYALTPAGWLKLEPIGGAGVPGTGFVAMSFDPTLLPIYDEGIRPAIEDDCGLKALRVDREEHNDDITDRILAGIRSAQFVVADFTHQRQGVYFEAGFALGLGRVVIWTCREDHVQGLHFDTRQYSHIVWTSPADLRSKLASRIQATVALPARLT